MVMCISWSGLNLRITACQGEPPHTTTPTQCSNLAQHHVASEAQGTQKDNMKTARSATRLQACLNSHMSARPRIHAQLGEHTMAGQIGWERN